MRIERERRGPHAFCPARPAARKFGAARRRGIAPGGLGRPRIRVSTLRGSTPAGIAKRFPAGGFPCLAGCVLLRSRYHFGLGSQSFGAGNSIPQSLISSCVMRVHAPLRTPSTMEMSCPSASTCLGRFALTRLGMTTIPPVLPPGGQTSRCHNPYGPESACLSGHTILEQFPKILRKVQRSGNRMAALPSLAGVSPPASSALPCNSCLRFLFSHYFWELLQDLFTQGQTHIFPANFVVCGVKNLLTYASTPTNFCLAASEN